MSNYTSELNDILNLSEHTDVKNINNYFTFDSRTRKITIPASFVTLGVESDDSSERVWFEGPRIVGDNIDLTTRNIYINYENANGEKDKYYVEDIVAEDDIVHFSWKVKRKVVAYKGNVTFLICALITDEEGKVETEWHTSRCTAPVLEGLEVENPAPPAEEYDLINQLIDVTKKSIKDVTDTCSQTIEELGAKEQEAINNIAEKETNSIDAVEKAKNDAVGYIGNGLDSTLTKQGIAAESQAVGDAILKARIVDRASGELISLSDSAEAPLQSMKIFGKTKQFTTTGKNKLLYPYYHAGFTKNGITFTDNGDGSISVSGTAEADTNFFFTTSSSGIKFEAGKTYCIFAGTKTVKGIMTYKDENGSSKNIGYAMATSVLWAENYTFSNYYISVPSGATVNDRVYPIIAEGSSYDGVWEPYTGGIPSPNPNYPQELVSVGDSGSTTEYVMGGNLFDGGLETGAIDSSTGTNITTAGGKRSVNYIPILPNATYTILREDTTKNIRLRFYDKNKNYIGYGFSAKVSPFTFTAKDDYAYMRLDLVGSDINEKVQIVLGSTEKPYEPYKEQSLILSTPNGLPGIPVSSSSPGNYIDENGQKWVCDEVDFERGVYIKNISSCTFDNNTVIAKTEACDTSQGCSEEERRIYITGPANMKRQGSLSNSIISTHYVANGNRVWYGLANAIYISSNNFILHHFGMTTRELYKEWLSSNPVTVYYELAEPIETPLTEEEIQTYKGLHTNYPNTTIYNSDGAGAEVEYLADTKLYVDNKIDKAIKNILEVVSNDG